MLGTLAMLAALAPAAGAQEPGPEGPQPVPELRAVTPLDNGVQRYHFSYGPIHAAPGQNLILAGPVTIEKPAYDGYMTRFKPDLVKADGSVPNVDVIHLHHGVWLNASRRDATSPGLPGERFAASGEEKTIAELPPGYGYPVKATDVWVMNHMIHNQTAVPENVWITYDVDFVPASSPLAEGMKPVRTIWLDVVNGSAYPVFDVKRGSGTGGEFAYPRDAPGAPTLNRWRVDRPGSLVWTAGHVHPGGLRTELEVVRGTQRTWVFNSVAEYFDPNGPVSWDMAMTATPEDWRVGLQAGDVLEVNAVYETERASWYESMGIMIGYMSDESGPDPFVSPPQTSGAVTHGHLPENENYGGADTGLPDPARLPDGQTLLAKVGVMGFQYMPGGMGLPGPFGLPPAVEQGAPLRFENADAAANIFHTITACKAPCTASTGISYPLADGEVDFDSGQLGYGPPRFTAAANRYAWNVPTDKLDPGTYSYFCRVHPSMRGAFRVTPAQ